MQETIYKLKALQSIEPDAVWREEKKRKLLDKVSVFGVQNDIFLNSNDMFARKSKFDIRSLMPNRFAVSFTSIVVLLTSGVLTVGASQSSLPGEALYSVKKATEQVTLAVASDQDRPKIEIEQAGKRLEELAQISQKASDSDQHEKVQQLVEEFQEKVDSANNHLSQLSDKGKGNGSTKGQVANVAKVVNEQSEKYTEVLQKTTEGLPETVKERVAGQVADATKTAEKVNMAALMVMADNTPDSGEVAAKVQKTVEKAEVKLNEAATTAATAPAAGGTDTSGAACTQSATEGTGSTAAAEDKAVKTEEAKKELEKAKENLKNNNLIDTLKNVATVTEITEKVATSDAGAVLPAATEGTSIPAAETPIQGGN